ncbi:hypothetical protein ALC56_00898 [Trachymyrmex septentrionalis]|uniref:Endonuclease/exonuclease/phosphatase domain-containing protein n=1 Tax=Trachymyrmex septentrionalis TaxID=34720 RepID=A0A195FX58_9HYME|nr:hypothetical protein ALC56_00898 [Trachymyrmex septentrionalis]
MPVSERTLSQSQRSICIFIRREIEFREIDFSHITHDSIEVQGICIRFNNNSLNVVNLYRHSGTNTPAEIFRNIFEFFGDDNVLILGDFNSHYAAYGSSSDTGYSDHLPIHTQVGGF